MLSPCSAASSVLVVAARARLEPVALAHAVVERGVGVEAGLVDVVQGLERGRAVRLLAPRRQDRAVLPVRDRDLLAVRERDRRELRVGGRQRAVGVARRRRQAARRATSAARPPRRARAPAGGRDPRSRSGRAPAPDRRPSSCADGRRAESAAARG